VSARYIRETRLIFGLGLGKYNFAADS